MGDTNMTPFKLSWKVTQFVLWLVLMLGVAPGALVLGGLYAVAQYRQHHVQFDPTQPYEDVAR